LLDLAEQAFFRCEQGACAVHVDGARFEDDPAVIVLRWALFGVGGFRHEELIFSSWR